MSNIDFCVARTKLLSADILLVPLNTCKYIDFIKIGSQRKPCYDMRLFEFIPNVLTLGLFLDEKVKRSRLDQIDILYSAPCKLFKDLVLPPFFIKLFVNYERGGGPRYVQTRSHVNRGHERHVLRPARRRRCN